MLFQALTFLPIPGLVSQLDTQKGSQLCDMLPSVVRLHGLGGDALPQ
jgi:hypothetical protein